MWKKLKGFCGLRGIGDDWIEERELLELVTGLYKEIKYQLGSIAIPHFLLRVTDYMFLLFQN